jgi:hypothetical protein
MTLTMGKPIKVTSRYDLYDYDIPQVYRNAFENACDCHYYGMSSREWVDCGIPSEHRAAIWEAAFYLLAEEECYLKPVWEATL